MPSRWLSVLLLGAGLLVGPAARAGSPALSEAWPDSFPSPSLIRSWERVDGQVETAAEAVTYRLWVNPARLAIYELTQYRVERIENGRRRAQSEKILWNPSPGRRQPILCFERTGGGWQQLAPDTPAYRDEMYTAIRVYSLHREAARAGGG